MKILFTEKPAITETEVEEALAFSEKQVLRNLPEFTEKFHIPSVPPHFGGQSSYFSDT